VHPLTALSEYRLSYRAIRHFDINRIPDVPKSKRLRNFYRDFQRFDPALSGLRSLP
jgi:hypothetical protein